MVTLLYNHQDRISMDFRQLDFHLYFELEDAQRQQFWRLHFQNKIITLN